VASSAALSGSHHKAPGFAGGYLLLPLIILDDLITLQQVEVIDRHRKASATEFFASNISGPQRFRNDHKNKLGGLDWLNSVRQRTIRAVLGIFRYLHRVVEMRQNARRARITQPPDACAPLARMELRDELRDSISRWLACRHFRMA
jgi:hypothetical protein